MKKLKPIISQLNVSDPDPVRGQCQPSVSGGRDEGGLVQHREKYVVSTISDDSFKLAWL